MARSKHQKLRILFVLAFLMRCKNGDGRTMHEILVMLGNEGINAKRKAVYDDLQELESLGFLVSRVRTRNSTLYSVHGASNFFQEAL